MNIVVGTAGHIDHGKTALVQALTGINADRLPEEKRKQGRLMGLTLAMGARMEESRPAAGVASRLHSQGRQQERRTDQMESHACSFPAAVVLPALRNSRLRIR